VDRQDSQLTKELFMKSRKTQEQTATSQPKGKAKLKNLKLTKEVIETLSERNAGAVKGGANYSRNFSGGY
jgi:hypothetical protein